MQKAAFSPTWYWYYGILYEGIVFGTIPKEDIIFWGMGTIIMINNRCYFNHPKKKTRLDSRYIILKDRRNLLYFTLPLKEFLKVAKKA